MQFFGVVGDIFVGNGTVVITPRTRWSAEIGVGQAVILENSDGARIRTHVTGTEFSRPSREPHLLRGYGLGKGVTRNMVAVGDRVYLSEKSEPAVPPETSE